MTHNNATRPTTAPMPARVAVTTADSGSSAHSALERASGIAARLALPFIDPVRRTGTGNSDPQPSTDAADEVTDWDYLLVVGLPGELALHSTGDTHGPVSIDFRQGRAAHRQRYGGGRKQPLARAVGVGKPGINTVIDATAGYGSDAYVMASLGLEVTLLEQSPVLALMLEEAIRAACADAATAPIAGRMRVVHTESTSWLSERSPPVADVIYLDPMYPQRERTAKVKKGMQLLHRLIGPNDENHALLQSALLQAGRRVVVKRPVWAEPLLDDKLTSTQRIEIQSPNTRYDVYPSGPQPSP